MAAALVVPVIRLNRRRAARAAESRYPQFEERLLTFTESMEQNPADPFLPLLADDTLAVAQQAEPEGVAEQLVDFQLLLGRGGRALASDLAGHFRPGLPGLRHVAALGRAAQGRDQAVLRHPGGSRQPDRAQARRPVDHRARCSGFTAPKVRFFAKYASASQWEQAEMRRSRAARLTSF